MKTILLTLTIALIPFNSNPSSLLHHPNFEKKDIGIQVADAVCCSNIPRGYDKKGEYCGNGPCNIFGCNCDDGCDQRCERAAREAAGIFDVGVKFKTAESVDNTLDKTIEGVNGVLKTIFIGGAGYLILQRVLR